MDYILKRNKDGSIIWTKEQIKYITNHYNKYHSTGTLGKQFNVSGAAIRNCLKTNGVKILSLKDIQYKKHPRNSHTFSKINTKEKAYWLGFLYADGCVSEKTNSISLNIKESDEYHLRHFLTFIKSDNKISHSVKKINGKEYKISHCSIRDQRLKKDLISLGCVPNKTYNNLHMPALRNDLMWHFVRGFFDGDGSINYSNKNIRISFTNNSEIFLEELRRFLQKDKIALDKHKTPMLAITGNKQLKGILDNIYKDSNDKIRLERKYNIYRNHYSLCA